MGFVYLDFVVEKRDFKLEFPNSIVEMVKRFGSNSYRPQSRDSGFEMCSPYMTLLDRKKSMNLYWAASIVATI